MLLLALLAVVVSTFGDYGITWDEPSNRNYASSVVRWYESSGRDQAAITAAMRHYGGLFELVATLAERALPFGTYESRHLATALVGVLGIVFTYMLGKALGGRTTGLVAASLLTLTPVYYGHMFANPKDVPFAALYSLALVAILRWYQSWPSAGWRHALAVGAATGLAAAVRVGGLVLFLVLTLAVALRLASDWRRRDRRPWNRETLRALTPLCAAPPIAWVVMCAFWPFAMVSPIAHPLEALRAFSQYSWHGKVLLGGRLFDAHNLPWDYLPRWFLVTTPDSTLVAVGIVVAMVLLTRLWRLSGWCRGELAVLVAAAAVPFAVLVANHATLYDGLRHVLFIIPPLSAVLAHLLVCGFRALPHRRERLAAAFLLALAAAVMIADMVRLHPYQYVYFNRIVAGGLRGAAGKYETDYWGASLKEAAEWTVAHVPATAGQPVRVGNSCSPDLTGYFIARDPNAKDRFVNVDVGNVLRGDVDIALAITRGGRHEKLPGKVLHRVERDGAALAYVIAVDHTTAIAELGQGGQGAPAEHSSATRPEY
ncbi:MAG: hypothetical protein H6Q33_5213 [Deltaproteobacteria bacterium]|jgi:hypothetical protein|nr:hypothetical protein [Deltaproteobacteria bacterium]